MPLIGAPSAFFTDPLTPHKTPMSMLTLTRSVVPTATKVADFRVASLEPVPAFWNSQ